MTGSSLYWPAYCVRAYGDIIDVKTESRALSHDITYPEKRFVLASYSEIDGKWIFTLMNLIGLSACVRSKICLGVHTGCRQHVPAFYLQPNLKYYCLESHAGGDQALSKTTLQTKIFLLESFNWQSTSQIYYPHLDAIFLLQNDVPWHFNKYWAKGKEVHRLLVFQYHHYVTAYYWE